MGTLDRLRKRKIGCDGHFSHESSEVKPDEVEAKAPDEAPKENVPIGEVKSKTVPEIKEFEPEKSVGLPLPGKPKKGAMVSAKVEKVVSHRKDEYDTYLESDRWKELRKECLERDGHRCRICNKSAQHVHHRTYPEVYGTETIDDLTSLCAICHLIHHDGDPGIKELRKGIVALMENGESVICPVCTQNCSYLKEGIDHEKAFWICRLVALAGKDRNWVHCGEIIPRPEGGKSSSTGTRLRFWKPSMAEMKPNSDDPSKNCSGIWRPTPEGVAFAKGNILAPKYGWFFKARPLWFSSKKDEQVDVHEGLGHYFDWAEISQPGPLPEGYFEEAKAKAKAKAKASAKAKSSANKANKAKSKEEPKPEEDYEDAIPA